LIDFVNKHHRLLRRNKTGIPHGLGEDVNDPTTWLRARFSAALRMPKALSALIDETLPEAFGPPGAPGDPEKIVFVAATIASIYLDALRWSSRVRTANIDQRFARLSMIASSMVDDRIRQIADFGPHVLDTWQEALAAPETSQRE
jgi:hypothetical protein